METNTLPLYHQQHITKSYLKNIFWTSCLPAIPKILLLLALVFSLLLNVYSSYSYVPQSYSRERLQNISPLFPTGSHLVVVAGHAVFGGLDYSKIYDEEGWILLDYQRGQLSTMIKVFSAMFYSTF